MRVLIFWNDQFLGRNGGMEKVFCNLSNELTRRGHQVFSAFCTEKTGKIYTPLDPKVQLINLADRLPGKKWESTVSLGYILKREYLRIVAREKMLDYRVNSRISKLFYALGGGNC